MYVAVKTFTIYV